MFGQHDKWSAVGRIAGKGVSKKVLALFIAALLISIAAVGISGAAGPAGPWVIVDDVNGGDCDFIGSWDAGTKTCTLDGNLTAIGDGITISSNGVILEGNEYTLSGSGSGTGVLFASRNGGGR